MSSFVQWERSEKVKNGPTKSKHVKYCPTKSKHVQFCPKLLKDQHMFSNETYTTSGILDVIALSISSRDSFLNWIATYDWSGDILIRHKDDSTWNLAFFPETKVIFSMMSKNVQDSIMVFGHNWTNGIKHCLVQICLMFFEQNTCRIYDKPQTEFRWLDCIILIL